MTNGGSEVQSTQQIFDGVDVYLMKSCKQNSALDVFADGHRSPIRACNRFGNKQVSQLFIVDLKLELALFEQNLMARCILRRKSLAFANFSPPAHSLLLEMLDLVWSALSIWWAFSFQKIRLALEVEVLIASQRATVLHVG